MKEACMHDMRRTRCRTLWAALPAMLALGLFAIPARADSVAVQGREVTAKFSDAVVTVKLAVKMRISMEGHEQEEESTAEITATMIDPTGLAVCALSEADPTNAIGRMMEEDSDTHVQVDVTDTKVRLANGTELPAKIVLRDKDLDLAFIRLVKAPEKPLPAIDLAASAPVEALDEVVILNRMNEVANRIPSAVVDRIAGVVKKPRLIYVPGPLGQFSNLGCPALTLDGKVIGVIVNRFPPQGSGATREERAPLSVIIPADDVAESAKQAPATVPNAPAAPAAPASATPAPKEPAK